MKVPASFTEIGFIPVPIVKLIDVPPVYEETPNGLVRIITLLLMLQPDGLAIKFPEMGVIEQGLISVSLKKVSDVGKFIIILEFVLRLSVGLKVIV